MFELISDLVTLMFKDSLRVDEVVAAVGTVVSNPPTPVPIEIKPYSLHIRSAWLARDPESGLPYVLSLKLARQTKITAGELKALLGDFSPVATDRGRQPQIIFHLKRKTISTTIAVVADLDKGSGSIEDTRISEIRFRRDH